MYFFETIIKYLQLGFIHVIPTGFDHILYILCLFVFSSNVKTVLLQCSVFTVAHSLSLGLAATGFIMPNSSIIEPIIAASILFTAVENIIHSKINAGRIFLIFGFGLIHGLGFANALNEIGLPKNQFLTSLLSFNLGVELGQLTVILAAYFLISKWFNKKHWYKERIIYPISSIIGCIALYWTIERILFVN
jgi:hypothetical protein